MGSEAVVGLLAVLFTSGFAGTVITALSSRRKNLREAEAEKRKAESESSATAVEGFRSLVESLQEQVRDLSTRLEKVEKDITVERNIKWVAVQYIRELLSWIRAHDPNAVPPEVPEPLNRHVVVYYADHKKEDQP